MPRASCHGWGQQIELPVGIKSGDIVDCPNWAGLALRVSEKRGVWSVTEVKKASCAVGEETLILPDDVQPGDIIECHGVKQRVTYEFGAYALEKVQWALRQWNKQSDQQVMNAVQADQLGAFETLYTRYRVRLYNFIRRFIGDPGLAEDIFQETFLRVYRNRHQYKAQAAVSTWIYAIARNLCLHEIEKQSSRQPTFADPVTLNAAPASPLEDPLGRLEANDTASSIARAVTLLPPGEREVLILARYEGLPHSQIAAIVGKSEGAVRVALSRAVTGLRERLQKDQ